MAIQLAGSFIYPHHSDFVARLIYGIAELKEREAIMGGLQIENLLNLMEVNAPFDPEQARREFLDYLKSHMTEVAEELEKKGEAVILTSSGSFRLTRNDLVPA